MLLLSCLSFLLLLALLRGKECIKPCQCCKAGTCTDGQEKCQGCIDGYSGDKCTIPCPTNCVNCSQTYFTSGKVCSACKDGFYNGRYQDELSYTLQENCALSCKPGCGTCAFFNYCLKCMDGHFSTSSRECFACPMYCKLCNNETTCIKCMESYYWNGQVGKCQHCKFRCKKCKSYDICSECENGFYLEDTGCIKCDEGCISCEKFDSCRICGRGYFQLDDRCVPCKLNCSDCSYSTQKPYICNACDNGYFLFNNTCYEFCGNGCSECLTNTQCKICKKEYVNQDGRCLKCPVKCLSCSSEENCTQCESGYYGEDCLLPCPANCNECQMEDGTCLTCRHGYFLDDTEICLRCPVHCVDCSSFGSCLICQSGYKGLSCQEACDNCRPATKCDKSSGYCHEACRDGLSGSNCDVNCTANCLTCDRSNPQKCQICDANSYGSDCSGKCPLHCKSNACVDGLCTLGCKVGYWGNRCDQHCSLYCNSNVCVEIDGNCTLGCDVGYWGNQCDNNCHYNCNRGICDVNEGTCTYGCEDNYTENNCKCSSKCYCGLNDTCESCEKGWYGYLCKHRCSTGCADGECFKQNGTCIKGCEGGFKGYNCTEEAVSSSIGYTYTALLVSGVTVLAFICCIVVVCIVIKRRRRQRRQSFSAQVPEEDEDLLDYTALRSTFTESSFRLSYTPLSDVALSQNDSSKYRGSLQYTNVSAL